VGRLFWGIPVCIVKHRQIFVFAEASLGVFNLGRIKVPDTSFILYYVVSICALLAVLLFIGSVGWWLMGTFYRAIKWLLSLIADQLRHYRDQVKFLIGAYTWLSAVAITSISIMLIQAAITPLPSPHDFFLHLNSALSWPIAPAMPYVKGPIHETTSAQASEKAPHCRD